MRSQPNRVFALARVSGRDQGKHGTSLDGQSAAFESYCKRLGHSAPKTRVEVESAAPEKLERRTKLHALIAEVRSGDLILVTMVDRWSRDLGYSVNSVRELVARGVGWVAIEEGIDASTPEGDSALGMRAWAADQERQRIRRRTVGRRAELKDQGYYVEGPAPFGLRRGPRPQHLHRTLVVEPDEAPIVVETFERAEHQTLRVIASWLNEVSKRHWYHDSVHNMLRNRIYLGEAKDGSNRWVPSRHVPALVERALFDRVQLAMSARRREGPAPQRRTLHWLVRGLGSCPECGAKMSASFGRRPPPWGYYACGKALRRKGSCSALRVRVEDADEMAAEHTLLHLRALREELVRPVREERPPQRARDFAAERRRIEQARERAVRLCVEETISAEDLRRERARLDEQLRSVESDAAEVAHRETAATPGARRELLGKLGAVERSWARMAVAERREVVRLLARRIVIRRGAVEIEWKPSDEIGAVTPRSET